jgi:hypothetical protein
MATTNLLQRLETGRKRTHFPVTPSKASCTFTETKGDFCIHAPDYEKMLTFVTMEDIVGGQVNYNDVIYNPNLSKEKNECILRKTHERHFPEKPITDDDLDMLCVYDKQHLNDFVLAYKKFLTA